MFSSCANGWFILCVVTHTADENVMYSYEIWRI